MKITSYIFFLFLLFFSSCKDEGAPLPDVFLNQEQRLVESVKYSLVSQYKIELSLVGETSSHFISVNGVPDGIVFLDNDALTENPISLRERTGGEITIRPSGTGILDFDIIISNEKNNTSVAYAEVNILENENPQARMILSQLDEVSDRHVRIDASESFDQDEELGGEIVEYEYTLDGIYTVETPDNILNYIFPERSTYLIKLRVKDNDGDWSDIIEETITIQ